MDLLKMPEVVYCEFNKDDYIIYQGEKLEFLYYLVSGSCYRLTVTENGCETIYGVKEPSKGVQSLLGVLTVYSDGISSNNFIAGTECSCYRIPKETFFKYVSDKPDILNELLRLAMWELRKVAGSYKCRQEGKTANRLCRLLLENTQDKRGDLIVSKKYNNVRMSQFLGVHEVTISRILRALIKEGLIKRKKDGLHILNEEKIKIYANSEEDVKY